MCDPYTAKQITDTVNAQGQAKASQPPAGAPTGKKFNSPPLNISPIKPDERFTTHPDYASGILGLKAFDEELQKAYSDPESLQKVSSTLNNLMNYFTVSMGDKFPGSPEQKGLIKRQDTILQKQNALKNKKI